MEEKKILFVTLGIKGPTPTGGIATAFYNLAQLARKQNLIVDVLYAVHPYYGATIKGANYWSRYFKKVNINFIPLEDEKRGVYGSTDMSRSFRVYNFLKKKQKEYSKVIFHDYRGVPYFSVLSKSIGLELQDLELIISAHGNTRLSDFFNKRYPRDLNALIAYFLEQKSLEHADLVITPSQYYLDWYQEQGYSIKPEHSKVIQNILLDSSIHKVVAKQPSTQVHFCFFGRVESLKGIFLFLQAVGMLLKEAEKTGFDAEKKLRVSIIGDPTVFNGEDISRQVSKYTEQWPFEWKWIKDFNTTQALTYIKENNGIIVNPTLGETSSYTVLEALIYDIPFIASDIPGIQELVSPEYHETNLFKAGDAYSLANLMKEAIVSGGKKAEPKITPEATKQEWINVFTNPLSATKKHKVARSTNSPLVSVIIPTTGTRATIYDTIRSIISQEYKNMEVLIGLDGLTYDDFAERNRNVVELLSETGINFNIIGFDKVYKSGVCNSLANKYATGEYLMFFDDDDIAKSNMVSTYVQCASNNQDVEVWTDFTECFEESEKGINVEWCSGKVNMKHFSLGIGDALSVNILANYFGKANIFTRKDVYIEVGGFTETSGLTPYVDWDYFLKCSINKKNIELIPEALYYYRMRSQNSIYYQSHDDNGFEAITKRYLAHSKLLQSITNGSCDLSKLKDYFLYTRSKMALPAVYPAVKPGNNNPKAEKDKGVKEELKAQIKNILIKVKNKVKELR